SPRPRDWRREGCSGPRTRAAPARPPPRPAAPTRRGTRARERRRRREASFRILEVDVAGLNGAVGTPLQVRVKPVEVLGDHLAAVEVRHALLGAAFHQRLLELVLGKPLQAFEEGRSDQALLLRSVTALAGERAPGPPAVERRLVDLVAVHDLVGRAV